MLGRFLILDGRAGRRPKAKDGGEGIMWIGRGGGDSDDIDLHLQYRTTTRRTGVHKTTRHRIYIHTYIYIHIPIYMYNV